MRPKGRRFARNPAQLVPPEKRRTGRLLDAGCGTGEITATIASTQDRFAIDAVDLTPRSLEIAGVFAPQRRLNIR